jgi:hypothetical protein
MSNTTAPAIPDAEAAAEVEVEVEVDPAAELAASLHPDLLALVSKLQGGGFVVLDPNEAAQLGDLALFAGYARDRLYPLVVALGPVAARAQQIGADLQTMGPMQLVGLLTGRQG